MAIQMAFNQLSTGSARGYRINQRDDHNSAATISPVEIWVLLGWRAPRALSHILMHAAIHHANSAATISSYAYPGFGGFSSVGAWSWCGVQRNVDRLPDRRRSLAYIVAVPATANIT
jgi:hypothetical protein